MKSIDLVANNLKVSHSQVENTLKLLNEGATVPFIARYRKNVTGNLNEEIIEKIFEQFKYNEELNKRKETIIKILSESKLLTDELKNAIENTKQKQELENIYEPFKVGKKTKASEAIEKGLMPFALEILNNKDDNYKIFKNAEKYLDKFSTKDEVIENVQYVIAQLIYQDIENRNLIKKYVYENGKIITKIKKNARDENKVFEQYYDYYEKVKYIPNHRILAISRGENLKILSYDITFYITPIEKELREKYFKSRATAHYINLAINDCLNRLFFPSIIREIKSDLFERAEQDAIELFGKSLEQMLLAPAIKNKIILAIDPGFINGCKIAILNENGKLLDKRIIYPNTQKNNSNQDEKLINFLIDKYSIDLIVIGNGTASQETKEFISKVLDIRKKENFKDHLKCLIVSEIGASVYSASKIAIEEFPKLSVEERSAISIGRRFQDPLNELVKIDPKSIGIGQYQHDVNQKELSKHLEFKVNKVVNMVGVDLNTTNKIILSFISGLNEKLANNIIEYREKNGIFSSRKELLDVKGINEKVYEQCIGFLRIFDSSTFYDKTNIHPESYNNANKLVKYLNIDLNNINKETLKNANLDLLEKELNINKYDLTLIIDSLLNPGKDIRDEKEGFIINEGIKSFEDLKVGQELIGHVSNITDFGAFIFIGIKNNVLVHIKYMKKSPNQFVSHPSEVLSIGDNVKIRIIDINKENKRIQGQILW